MARVWSQPELGTLRLDMTDDNDHWTTYDNQPKFGMFRLDSTDDDNNW